jgi:hypothetical protein
VDAFRKGRAETKAGFPRKVRRGDNDRSIANHPVQGTGGDLMRLCVIYLTEGGAELVATNHDSFLFTCRRDELDDLKAVIDASLRRAVNQLLPGCPMRWAMEVYEDRYREEDGATLWEEVATFLGVEGMTPVSSHP